MFTNHITHNKKLRSLVALALLALPMPTLNTSVRAASSSTYVGGPIISDTTWTLAQSPIIVTSNVQVMPGVKLTIQPGVVVRFNEATAMLVDGMLVARGTLNNLITFTSNQSSPQPGDWANINFNGSGFDATFDPSGNYIDGDILQYCVVEYGGDTDPLTGERSPYYGAVMAYASPYIDHSTIRYNRGTGIIAETVSPRTPLIISNNAVLYNTADMTWDHFRGGGGILLYATSAAIVSGNTISGNSINGEYANGGGVWASGSPITITGNIITHNTANGADAQGGGIGVFSGTIINNVISDNSAPGSSDTGGGGIYVYVKAEILNNTISRNSTTAYGGGIYAENAPPQGTSTIEGNTITGNSSGILGGGIVSIGGIVRNNVIADNIANMYGGGIASKYDEDFPAVVSNTIKNNSATYGGGIYAAPDYYGGQRLITGNSINDNQAWEDGGGIYISYGQVMTNTIYGNSARYSGGGIYAQSSTVVNNLVKNNAASLLYYGDGGGIYASDSDVMTNTIVANTTPQTGKGVGVYFDGSSTLMCNTVAGNSTTSSTAIVGGIAISGTPKFYSNSLYGNANFDAVVVSTRTVTATNNFWGTTSAPEIATHIYDGNDNAALGTLTFSPFLQTPDPCAPVPPPISLQAKFTSGSTVLSWDAISGTITSYGYKIYYDTDSSGPPYNGTGAAQGNSPIDVGNVTIDIKKMK